MEWSVYLFWAVAAVVILLVIGCFIGIFIEESNAEDVQSYWDRKLGEQHRVSRSGGHR
jgi:uncharacterized membrane protein YraQ (UPF0718 family)